MQDPLVHVDDHEQMDQDRNEIHGEVSLNVSLERTL